MQHSEIRPTRFDKRADDGERLVAVRDALLCLRVQGIGSPTVVFDSSIGKGRDAWNKVAPSVATLTRVCTYDRKGIGKSSAPFLRHTCAEMARDLHEMLQNARIEPPYVLVGHSIGGINVRLFAAEHPELVAGMVLVDASGPTRPFSELLLPSQIEARRSKFDQSSEHLDYDAFAESGELAERLSTTLEDKPLVVVTRGKPGAPNGVSPAVAAEWFRLWNEQQARLLRLSNNSVHFVARDSGHMIPDETPELVVAAVNAVVHACRGRVARAY